MFLRLIVLTVAVLGYPASPVPPEVLLKQVVKMPAKDSTLILQRLRGFMNNLDVVPNQLDAYIIPSGDAHNSEYTADCDQRRGYVSGFDGSLGTAIVTRTGAYMWTDGRYYLQARQEMDNNWTLMKMGLPETPTETAWLAKALPSGSFVGVDPLLMSQDQWESTFQELRNSGTTLSAVDKNLVDFVWTDRPLRPNHEVIQLEEKYNGKRTSQKVADVRKELVSSRCDYLVVTELDEIAWLLNLRGSDIPFNPVFFAYVLITPSAVEIFIDPSKMTMAVKEKLASEISVLTFHAYEDIGQRVAAHVEQSTGRFFVSKYCSHALADLIPEARRTMKVTPIALMKAIKNSVEVEGMDNAHIRDAAALCEFFAWLEKEMNAGNPSGVSEISAADKLEQCRANQKDFMGLSFPAISSSGPNGAVIHYRPAPETNRTLTSDEMYLIDSGGQYRDGTTDVTRTLHFGSPTDFQRDCFTRVLKGQIALVSAVFPTKVVGNTLDTLARKALWDVGLDYIHGTGHGIGHFLNVHEGPHGITYKTMPNDPGLQANMFVSNEPGYYQDNEFGIRIENIIRVVPKTGLPNNFGNRGYLTFTDVTFVPIQQKLIKTELLTEPEINHINQYHQDCRQRVGKYMEANGQDKDGLKWLLKETEPLRTN